MRLKELIGLCDFDIFFDELLANYADIDESSRETVKTGYKDLQELEPSDIEEEFEILIEFIEEEGFYDVSGKKSDEDELYSLMFIDWTDWLNFVIDDSIFQLMMPEKVLAHIYWEMTWKGFTYEETNESQIEQELEASYIKALESLIGELRYKKEIDIEDLKEYIDKYQQTPSKEVRSAIERSIEVLIISSVLSHEVKQYLIEVLEDEELKRLLQESGK